MLTGKILTTFIYACLKLSKLKTEDFFFSFYRLKISSECIFYSRKINSNVLQDDNLLMLMINFVVNKAKRRISKRVFQENQARQIFRKTKISYHLIRTRTCAYQGVRNVRFSENLTWFIFLKYPFWDSPFCLVTDECLFSKQKKYYEGLVRPLQQTFTCTKSTIETSEKDVEYL